MGIFVKADVVLALGYSWVLGSCTCKATGVEFNALLGRFGL